MREILDVPTQSVHKINNVIYWCTLYRTLLPHGCYTYMHLDVFAQCLNIKSHKHNRDPDLTQPHSFLENNSLTAPDQCIAIVVSTSLKEATSDIHNDVFCSWMAQQKTKPVKHVSRALRLRLPSRQHVSSNQCSYHMEHSLQTEHTTTFQNVLVNLTHQSRMHTTTNNGMLCLQASAIPNEKNDHVLEHPSTVTQWTHLSFSNRSCLVVWVATCLNFQDTINCSSVSFIRTSARRQQAVSLHQCQTASNSQFNHPDILFCRTLFKVPNCNHSIVAWYSK